MFLIAASIFEKQFYTFDRNLSKYPIDIMSIKSFNYLNKMKENLLIRFQEFNDDSFSLQFKHLDRNTVFLCVVNLLFVSTYLFIHKYFDPDEAFLRINNRKVNDLQKIKKQFPREIPYKDVTKGAIGKNNEIEDGQMVTSFLNIHKTKKILLLILIGLLHISYIYYFDNNGIIYFFVLFNVLTNVWTLLLFFRYFSFNNNYFLAPVLFVAIHLLLKLMFNYIFQIINKTYYKMINLLFLLISVLLLIKIFIIILDSNIIHNLYQTQRVG